MMPEWWAPGIDTSPFGRLGTECSRFAGVSKLLVQKGGLIVSWIAGRLRSIFSTFKISRTFVLFFLGSLCHCVVKLGVIDANEIACDEALLDTSLMPFQ
jgi:hypothetical protein